MSCVKGCYGGHRSVAQPGSASGLGPEGRRFESSRSDQTPGKCGKCGGESVEYPEGKVRKIRKLLTDLVASVRFWQVFDRKLKRMAEQLKRAVEQLKQTAEH